MVVYTVQIVDENSTQGEEHIVGKEPDLFCENIFRIELVR